MKSKNPTFNTILSDSNRSEERRRKRKRIEENQQPDFSEIQSTNESHLQQIQSLLSLESTIFHPLQISLLNKWSSKVEAATTTSSSSSTFTNPKEGLKSINQSSGKQVEMQLAGDGIARLISRTQVLRDPSISNSSLGSSGSKNLDGNTASTEDEKEDVEIFDDSDFYNSLLKELIESKGGGSGNGKGVAGVEIDGKGLDVMSYEALNGGKRKKVDTKGSKGRRLR